MTARTSGAVFYGFPFAFAPSPTSAGRWGLAVESGVRFLLVRSLRPASPWSWALAPAFS